MIRVAINGFGRIGRQVLQAGILDPAIEWVAINDLTDAPTLAYMLKYDSVHKRLNMQIDAQGNELVVNGKRIKVLAEKDPEKLPWKELGIDVVCECSGFFTDREGALKHIKAGARKVLISAPAKNPDITLVKGVNEHSYDKTKHAIISNASCTTNCLAPLVKVLDDNYGVEKGFMVTAHAYTADQRLVDGPHKDYRRGRSASVSIIPTTTGAARTVSETMPHLKGKLDGIALRVPVPDGSIVQFIAQLKKGVSVDEINALFKSVSEYHLKGILRYNNEQIVSQDIVDDPHSSIFDATLTMILENGFVMVSAWYDNEWGYSCRMVDVVKIVGG